jgi:hypothetical protein
MPRGYYFWRSSRIEGAGCKIVDNGDSKGVHCGEPAGLHAAGGALPQSRGSGTCQGTPRPAPVCAQRGWGLHRGAHCPCSVRANLGGHRLRAAPAALILSGAARGGLVARRRVWVRTPFRPHPGHRAEAVVARARPRLRCALPKLRTGEGAMSTPLHRLGCGPVGNGRAADLWSVVAVTTITGETARA